MTPERIEWLESFFGAVEESNQLSQWESDFIADQHTRYKQYGGDVRFSPKQWAILVRVATEKLGMDDPDDPGPGS